MATPIFRVDLSKDAQDFQPTATEPGLGMLDRQRANFIIMRRWFGRLVAEPAWQGKDRVAFYVQAEEEDARVEEVDCYPVTKDDLEGALNEELKGIQARIKRAKPQSDGEKSLHRVVRQTFNGLTGDLEDSDFDCYLFKYREGRQPWHLLWCWGYQRADQEPATSLVCTNTDCNQLFVRRESEKANCPGCATAVSGRRGPSAGGILGSRRAKRAVGLSALLLLLLLFVVLFFGQPKLVVEEDWTGPQGSKVTFNIKKHSWLIFKKDVSSTVTASAANGQMVAFDPVGATARAKLPGTTKVTFHVDKLLVEANAIVQPPLPPDRIVVEPSDVSLVVGEKQLFKLTGHYDGKDIEPIDFTDKANWSLEDPAIATLLDDFNDGKKQLEGEKEGETELLVGYKHAGQSNSKNATIKLSVNRGQYKSLEVTLDPESLKIGERGKLQVYAIDAKGNKYSKIGSTGLHLSVIPKDYASVDGFYVIGKKSGEVVIAANVGDVSQTLIFNVSKETTLQAGTFVVTPNSANMTVSQYLQLDVLSASQGPITAVSSDPSVVEVLRGTELVARKGGTATVTVKQGDHQTEVPLTVVDGTIDRLQIVPAIVALPVGTSQGIRVVASQIDEAGNVTREFDVAPDMLVWLRQPSINHVHFDRASMVMRGIRPTVSPLDLAVTMANGQSAAGYVKVVGNTTSSLSELDLLDFGAYPPIKPGMFGITGVPGTQFKIVDQGVYVDTIARGSPFAKYGIPAGSTITEINGTSIIDWDEDEVIAYLKKHQFGGGKYIDIMGNVRSWGGDIIVDIVVKKIEKFNLEATDFNVDFHVSLRRKGEYRVLVKDEEGTLIPVTDWKVYGPNDLSDPADLTHVLTDKKITRFGVDEYFYEIHLKVGDSIKVYPGAFRLDVAKP